MKCKLCSDFGYINNVFVVGDLRQAEAMIVGECLKRVGYPELHNIYKDRNFDIHRFAAAPIFKVKESEVTKYQREIGKLSNHSGNYGAGPRVLMDKALKDGIKGIDYQFAKHILEIRHKQLPGLKVWWKAVEQQVFSTRTITTCFGRRRIFFGPNNEKTVRDAISYEPQSTCGDVCNTIFRTLSEVLKFRSPGELCSMCYGSNDTFRSKASIGGTYLSLLPIPIIQIHDEVVVRCPNIPELVERTLEEFRKAANLPLYICGNNEEPLIIPIELKIGRNWKDTFEIASCELRRL
jgi:hypothetical protein